MFARLSFAAIAANFLSLTSIVTAQEAQQKLDASANTNVAVYWGQGPNQQRLGYFCRSTSIDIIPIGFVNVFPGQGNGSFPGSNFGNACGAYYTKPDGTQTQLLDNCVQIAEDIPYCQGLGKTILLSLGGASPSTYKINNDTEGAKFAESLWGAFGPKSSSWTGPRPFGAAAVDGFDFNIEHNGPTGYVAMVRRLRELFMTDKSTTRYISAAPECDLPDANLGTVLQSVPFDFIFIQFYNTRGCSARDYIAGTGDMNYDKWIALLKKGASTKAKVFIGLPGAPPAASSNFYLSPEEMMRVVDHFKSTHPVEFGGVMIWEATYADMNRNPQGKTFTDACKAVLLAGPTRETNSTSTSSSASSSSRISTPMSSSSSTTAVNSVSSPPPPKGGSTSTDSALLTRKTTSISTTSRVVVVPSSLSPTSSTSSTTKSSTSSSSTSVPITTTSITPAVIHQSNMTKTTYPTSLSSTVMINTNTTRTASSSIRSVNAFSYTAPTSSKSRTNTSAHHTSAAVSSSSSSEVVFITTVLTTQYIDICPTGFTTKTIEYTRSHHPRSTHRPHSTGVPAGWTTTVTVCTQCAAQPTTVTLTVPCTTTTTTETVSGTPISSDRTVVPAPSLISTPTSTSVGVFYQSTALSSTEGSTSLAAVGYMAPSIGSTTSFVTMTIMPLATLPASMPADMMVPPGPSAPAVSMPAVDMMVPPGPSAPAVSMPAVDMMVPSGPSVPATPTPAVNVYANPAPAESTMSVAVSSGPVDVPSPISSGPTSNSIPTGDSSAPAPVPSNVTTSAAPPAFTGAGVTDREVSLISMLFLALATGALMI